MTSKRRLLHTSFPLNENQPLGVAQFYVMVSKNVRLLLTRIMQYISNKFSLIQCVHIGIQSLLRKLPLVRSEHFFSDKIIYKYRGTFIQGTPQGPSQVSLECPLKRGWARQLIINQEIQHKKSLLIYLQEIIWWIHKSALRRELVTFLCESFHNCDKCAIRNINPLCGQSGTF